MKGERAIVRNRPGGGGPDNGADIASNSCNISSVANNNCKFHPDRRAGVIFVLDFRFGKRGAVEKTPVDRLAPAVYVSLFHEIQKRAGDGRFVFMAHRQVRIVPAAED